MYTISHTPQAQIANRCHNRSRVNAVPSTLFGSLFATTLALCLLASTFTASAVTVKVDSTKNWQGFNNVTGTNGFGTYFFGSDWALDELRAEFIQTNSNPSGWPVNDFGVLQVNTNTYDSSDPFWNDTNGISQVLIEANLYVDVFTNFAGESVTFEGTVISNSIPVATVGTNYPNTGLPTVDPAAWHVIAWVKEFTPGYGFIGITHSTNLAPGPFSVTRAIAAGSVCQYGFLTYGPNAAPGSADALTELRFGVEDSDPAILTQPVGGDIVVPDAVDLTGVAVGATAIGYQWQKDDTNLVDGGTISGATTTNLVISPSVAADSGDYTLIATNTAGSVTSDVASVTVVNILITDNPDDLRLQVGSTAMFTGAATSSVALTYRWFSSIGGGPTNIMFDGGTISGVTTPTLTLSNVQTSQSGTSYFLRFFDGTSSLFSSGAELLVRTPADWVNFLENPGFEKGKLDEDPWVRFESTDPVQGAVQDATDTYFGGGNVDIYEGDYVSFTTYHATWAGIYQDVPVEPGQFFVASMSFFNASGDPIPGPGLPATNQTYLEVQFRDAGDNVIQQYTTDLGAMASTNLPPQDVWFELVATNAGDFGGGSGTDGLYLEAPTNAVTARFQVTMNDQGGSSIGGVPLGSLYYDSASLLLKIPGEITVVDQVGGTTDVSWPSHAAMSYQVEYKDNIDDPTWTTLEVVAGDGTVITRSYASAGPHRFYRVLTQ